jgi:N-acetyl sugar amidotransferase
MQYCQKCVLPNTRPNLTINADGYCTACATSSEKPLIDWAHREVIFQNLVDEVKSQNCTYDCVIPVSGGKDSTWQVIKALEYGLTPICVTWRTPGRNSLGQQNLDNLIALGVDHIDISINPKVEKNFTLKSFERYGSPVIPMHMAIHAAPAQVAMEKNVPLILWGENSAVEYGGDDKKLKGMQISREWLMKYGVTHGTTAQDWTDDELSLKALAAYHWPEDFELQARNIRAVFLGQYFPWDPVMTAKVAGDHGFKAADKAIVGVFDFADVDDAFLMSIHHWMKWYKFGFTRSWDNLSLEIRSGRITREEAVREIEARGTETPMAEIIAFCGYAGITQEKFFEIAENFRNQEIWEKRDGVWKIKNFLSEDWKWSADL